MARWSDNPSATARRSRRCRELAALGYLTDRVTWQADALRLLVAAGYISDDLACSNDREARSARAQALSEFLAVALSALEAELMQHVAKATIGAGYSLRKRRV